MPKCIINKGQVTMIPPGECIYAGKKRRKPVQKQRPHSGCEKSNPSKRHRDRLNAELDRLASLLPFPHEIISKLDKLSILRLSVSFLRVKSFFQAIEEERSHQFCHAMKKDKPSLETVMPEGELLQESMNGFAIVVNTEGIIFYASSTISDYLGFHQTDVMHQNVYDYIHVEDRQEFCRQLHWAMNPRQMALDESQTETGEVMFLKKLLKAQASSTSEYSSFLNRYFICRIRCLLDSTSGFLTMQFEGRLKFLFGQKKVSSGKNVLPQMALFCIAAPLLLPPITEIKMKSVLAKSQRKPGAAYNTGNIENDNSRIKIQTNIPSIEGNTKGILCDSFIKQPAHLKCISWGKHKKEDKNKNGSFLQEETYFSKHFSGMQNQFNTNSNWTVTNSWGSRSSHHVIGSLSSRRRIPFYFMDQTYSGIHMAGRIHNGNMENFQTYQNGPQHSIDTYSGDDKNTDNTLSSHVSYDSELPLNIPIKIENDSDSEERSETNPDRYVYNWFKENNVLKRTLIGFPKVLQLKTESHQQEQNLCLKSKHHIHPHNRGQGFITAANIDHFNMNQPFQGLYNEESIQLNPQTSAYLDCILSQETGCLYRPNYASTSQKNQGEQQYKHQCEFKAQYLVQNIKHEPLDSPSWAENAEEIFTAVYQKKHIDGLFTPDAT